MRAVVVVGGRLQTVECLSVLVPQRFEHLRHGLRLAQNLVARHRRSLLANQLPDTRTHRLSQPRHFIIRVRYISLDCENL